MVGRILVYERAGPMKKASLIIVKRALGF